MQESQSPSIQVTSVQRLIHLHFPFGHFSIIHCPKFCCPHHLSLENEKFAELKGVKV